MSSLVSVSVLRENGYPVSNMKDEAVIGLAERDVIEAYFVEGEDFQSEASKQLLYALVYSTLLKRKTVSTRYGADVKTSQYTIQAEANQIKDEIRSYCRVKLEKYLSDNPTFEAQDFLEIYTKMFLI